MELSAASASKLTDAVVVILWVVTEVRIPTDFLRKDYLAVDQRGALAVGAPEVKPNAAALEIATVPADHMHMDQYKQMQGRSARATTCRCAYPSGSDEVLSEGRSASSQTTKLRSCSVQAQQPQHC
jgi:hypothetical protein